MSKILLIAAAVFLLGSSVLSFLNKGKMTDKTEEIKRVNGVAASAQGDATKARASLKEADKKLTEETTRAASLQTELAAASGNLATARDETKKAVDELADKQKEIDRLNGALIAAAGGKAPDPAAGDVAQQIQTLTAQRDELKTVSESLQNRVKGMESQVASLTRERNERISNTQRPGLSGRVLAVDRNWNFVVLSLGDRNGVSNNAQMVVRRGESMVGRVRVTTVEPSQSIADIVPNSVPPGVSVEAGDTVIFQ